jgi:hypothetical protein
MTLPTISAAPTFPQRLVDTGDAFVTKADAANLWLEGLPTELNAMATALATTYTADNFLATSSTSLAITVASKTFTIETGRIFQLGQFVIAASAANPANYMFGQVTAHNSSTGSLTVDVLAIGGSGTKTDWLISLAGPRGAAGTNGTNGVDAPQWATIASQNTTSGTSVSFTSIAATYRNLCLVFNGVSGTATGAMQIEFSHNGSSWSSVLSVYSSTSAANTYYGGIFIPDYANTTGGLCVVGLANLSSAPSAATNSASINGIARRVAGVQAIRISLTSFDAGSIDLRAC